MRINESTSTGYNEWSNRFYLDEIGDFHLQLIKNPTKGAAEKIFLDIDIFTKKGSQFIVFREGEPPFLLDNQSSVISSLLFFLQFFFFFSLKIKYK